MQYLATLDETSTGWPAANQGQYVASAITGMVSGQSVTVGDIFECTVNGTPANTPQNFTQLPLAHLTLSPVASFIPDYFVGIADYPALATAEQPVFSQLDADLRQLMANQFVQTCDKSTLVNFEAIFSLVANPAIESQQFRRLRLLNRYAAKPPFSMPYFASVLTMFFGADWWVYYTVNPSWNYKLNLWALGAQPFSSPTDSEIQASFPNDDLSTFTEVSNTIRAMIPSHVRYTYTTWPSDAPAGAIAGA